jgi:heme exporter protein A
VQVVGGNGSGKTSLLRIVSGLARARAGQVLWGGEPIDRAGEAYRAQLAYLGHSPGLKADLSPVENLTHACQLAGAPASHDDVQAALADAGLQAQAALPVRRLSQGQQQRVSLVRLRLLPRVRLWLLDEPANGLDAQAQSWLEALIARHCRQGGLVMFTSHTPLAVDAAPLGLEGHP